MRSLKTAQEEQLEDTAYKSANKTRKSKGT